MSIHQHHQPLERCLTWIERHPSTILYLLVVSTANFILSILNAAHVV